MMHSEDGSVTRGMTLQYKDIQRYSFIFFLGGGGEGGGGEGARACYTFISK